MLSYQGACPDPDSCGGAISVPVVHVESGQSNLLAACYHNLGETEVRPHFQHGSKVQVDGTVCCSFAMYSDEPAGGRKWADAVQAPVRTVVEIFKQGGLDHALSNPWGRSFRAKGRPSQPQFADSFQFFAIL